MNPTNNTADVFNFFGFSVHQKVLDFLDSHTKSNKGGVSSTFRDSKTAPFMWREKLSMAEVVSIQVAFSACKHLVASTKVKLWFSSLLPSYFSGKYWSERSACATRGSWLKRRWPLF